MPFLEFEELRKKTDKELEVLYGDNCGAPTGSCSEAEQSSNRNKIELVLRERVDLRHRIMEWIAIGTAWLAILFKN